MTKGNRNWKRDLDDYRFRDALFNVPKPLLPVVSQLFDVLDATVHPSPVPERRRTLRLVTSPHHLRRRKTDGSA